MSLSRTKEFDLQYKVIVIGESAVGKSSLIRSYANPNQPFTTNMISTVGIDFVNVDTKVDDLTVRLQIWDTAGQERFRTMTKSQFRGTKGVLLVYDITKAFSYDQLQFWIKSIKEFHSVTTNNSSKLRLELLMRMINYSLAMRSNSNLDLEPYWSLNGTNSLHHEEFLIVGNKYDLNDEREVPKKRGEELAKSLGVHYMETSAKTGVNVKEVFQSLATQMKDANDPFVHVRHEDLNRSFTDHPDGIIVPAKEDRTSESKKKGYSSYCCSG